MLCRTGSGKLLIMSGETKKTCCTDRRWLGRADCRHCHIRHLMLFSGLPESAFDDTLQPINHLLTRPGGVLFDVTETDPAIFAIRRGLVKLQHTATDGAQRIVRLLGPGSAIGLELLDGARRYRNTAIAVSEVDACRIPLSTARALQSKYPVLCGQVLRQLQDQLDLSDEWITALSTGPARERVANLLLMLVQFSTEANNDIELLPGEDMAAIVGTTVETVSRVVASLKRRQLLHKVAEGLYRVDEKALHAISREDAG